MKTKLLSVLAVMLLSIVPLLSQEDPWHLVAYSPQGADTLEVASFNMEDSVARIDPLLNAAQEIEGLKIVFQSGREFPCKTLGPFTFERRARGTGTAVEPISSSSLTIRTDGSTTRLTSDLPVSIFDIRGNRLVFDNRGAFSMNLLPGVYIARAGQQTQKFFSSGGPLVINARESVASFVQTRAAAAPVTRAEYRPSYLHFSYGDQSLELNVSIRFDEVQYFFVNRRGELLINLKNGEMLILEDYSGSVVAFLDRPIENPNVNFPLEENKKWCGAAYGMDFVTGESINVYLSAYHRLGYILIYDVTNNKEYAYSVKDIDPHLFEKSGRFSVVISPFTGYTLAMTYIELYPILNGLMVCFMHFDNYSIVDELGRGITYTIIIPTTWTQTADDGIIVSTSDGAHSFKFRYIP
ncbi:MAG: hypothetical protein LBD28_05115 [Tannerellaceae bacterium]|jgi:hypothetical protein|nr:hypothetical protein [Tannerellaceae bacterium]